MEIVDDMGLAPIFSLCHHWNTAAVLQFYATCLYENRNVTWMTGETKYTATFSQFARALGIARPSGHRIHANNKDKPKTVNDCLGFLRSGLEGDDQLSRPNDVSIWKQPYHFMYQCVLCT